MRAWEWIYLGLLAVVFAPAVLAMSEVWSQVDFMSHGYLVPFVALWAATGKRAVLPGLPRSRDARGLFCVAAALLLYLLGLATGSVTLSGLAVVGAATGAVWQLRGTAWLQALAFPLAYLAFMVPLPEPVLTPVILELRFFVTEVGVALLRLGGLPVYREGNLIEIPGGESLFVADACSGITSVITLLPLGVFLAYFTERTLARRAVLVAFVVPLAMFGNLLRVIVTVLAARAWGADAATKGSLHDSAGILTYVLGCLALLGVGWLMRRWWPPQPTARPASA